MEKVKGGQGICGKGGSRSATLSVTEVGLEQRLAVGDNPGRKEG